MKKVLVLAAALAIASACTGSFSDRPLDPTNTTGGDAGGTVIAGANGATAGTAGTADQAGHGGSQGPGDGAADSPGAAGAAGGCTNSEVPADVQAVLSTRCLACHGSSPLVGVPTSLVSYADLTAPSKTNPTLTNAQLAVMRMQSTTTPMPPSPLMRATSSEIATLEAWVAAGSPKAACAAGADAGTDGGGQVIDPFAAAPVCTSKRTWTSGNHGSSSMNPGLACISCHASRGEGPRFAFAGTLYPTAHEPDLCDGVSGGTTGAQIVVIDARGQSITVTPDTAGNFSWSGNLTTPYQAKVVFMGRERAMIESQTSGDCNNCHTQDGAMPSGTMKAPGRVLLP